MSAATPAGRSRPTTAEVDLAAIRSNAALLAELAHPAALCAVVKADGYGHGAVPVARAALAGGATWLAVALIEEGEALRAAGIDAPILLLAEPPPGMLPRALAAQLTPSVYSRAFGEAVDRAGRARDRPVAAHVKVDTGMARVGVPLAEWGDFARSCAGWGGVDVEAVWTHLACADEPDHPATARQLAALDEALDTAAAAGLHPRLVHAANSAATLTLPSSHRDLVRVGIALYGLSPSREVTAADAGLEPALRLTTAVAYAKRVPAGTAASYGHRWSAPADGWLVTLPVGYADGVPRRLSGRVDVLIGGAPRPVVGAVCMDQILVWCGDDPVAAGDEAVLLGRQGDAAVPVERWAAEAGTITYEIVTGLGSRVPRDHRDR